MARVLPENAAAAVEQDLVELFGGVITSYGYGWFREERLKDGNSVLAVLWLGVPKLSVSEEPYLGGRDHRVGLNLSCNALEEGLLVLWDSVGGVLGGDRDTSYCEGDFLSTD